MCGFTVHTSTFSFISVITFSLHATTGIPHLPPPPHRWYDKVLCAKSVNFTNRADSFLSVIGVGCLWRSSGVWLISAAGYNKQYAAISVDVCVICRTWGFETRGEILSCVCVMITDTAASSVSSPTVHVESDLNERMWCKFRKVVWSSVTQKRRWLLLFMCVCVLWRNEVGLRIEKKVLLLSAPVQVVPG